MELTVNQLHEFLHCPMKYRIVHKDGLQADDSKSVAYKKALHKTIYSFFHAVNGGWIPTPKQMKDRWSNTWDEFNNPTKDDLMKALVGERAHKGTDKHLIKGFEMIHYFYHFNKDNPGNPIAVDMEFRVPIAGIILKGNFELVREIVDESDGRRYIELVDFKTGSEKLDPFLIKNDLNLTIMSYAFRNLFQSSEDRLKYHYMETGRDIITTRSENDFKRLEATVKGVADAIKGNHFYPRQSFMCSSCPVKDMCDRIRF